MVAARGAALEAAARPARVRFVPRASSPQATSVSFPAEASGRLVGPPVFKTGEPARVGWRVRFPSASATSGFGVPGHRLGSLQGRQNRPLDDALGGFADFGFGKMKEPVGARGEFWTHEDTDPGTWSISRSPSVSPTAPVSRGSILGRSASCVSHGALSWDRKWWSNRPSDSTQVPVW